MGSSGSESKLNCEGSRLARVHIVLRTMEKSTQRIEGDMMRHTQQLM